MVADEGQRKLTAILAADVTGYSRLMAGDESATVLALKNARQVFQTRISAHNGRLIDATGDSVLAAFQSVVGAIECAVEVQDQLTTDNAALPDDRQMQFRIGVHLGDIIEERDGTIFGDGVNIAARLENLADPGGVMISEDAYRQVRRNPQLGFQDSGVHRLKNIPEPVRAYRITEPGGQPTRGRRPTRTDKPIIAVLPFDNLSGDSEQEFFADGITEDIITRLSQYQTLGVIARNSTFIYKGEPVDIRKIAKDLNADYVVEGSVRRAAQRVRITPQLIDTETLEHIWSDTYDRDLSAADVFAVQDDVTRRIAAVVADEHGVLLRRHGKSLPDKAPEELESYEAIFRLAAYNNNLTDETFQTALTCLERAVKHDPDYAAAWGGLAELYADGYALGFYRGSDPLDRALKAGEKAIALSPADQRARWGVAYAHFHRRDLDAFLRTVERVIEANPNNAYWMGVVGWALALAGQWERGRKLIEDAEQLNPNHPTTARYPLAIEHYVKGDYEAALQEIERTRNLAFFWTPLMNAAIYGRMGRRNEARTALADLRSMKPDALKRPGFYFGAYVFPEDIVAELVNGVEMAIAYQASD